MRSRIKVVVVATGIMLGLALPAHANPSPPTNGGNGAGKSGQCTGAAVDRPHSCQAWK